MNRRFLSILTLGAMGAALALGLTCLTTESLAAPKKVKRYKADKGPKTIDVSKYPKDMQRIYKDMFAKKCSKCHTLARAINTSKTAKKWKAYVQKMGKKRNSGIDKKSVELISKFLVYDQQQRKDKKKTTKK